MWVNIGAIDANIYEATVAFYSLTAGIAFCLIIASYACALIWHAYQACGDVINTYTFYNDVRGAFSFRPTYICGHGSC